VLYPLNISGKKASLLTTLKAVLIKKVMTTQSTSLTRWSGYYRFTKQKTMRVSQC